ncbi:unnamed protein product [Prorocentrum cordatum]|uniref:Uncharacterized protein n=1 Tax=Prorocentrum cordatum TaxID=2364126 RepID=A0ABN9TKV2_9DINO|nr:unnamed protein product [Polarella glacialis]
MGPHQRLAAAIAEAEAALAGEPRPLSQEERRGGEVRRLRRRKDAGYVFVRGLVPECLADVLREQVIHPGLKMERGFDVGDPTTWGKGGLARQALSWYEKLVTLLGSESPYYGARMNFGRALQRECRGDLTAAEFDLLEGPGPWRTPRPPGASAWCSTSWPGTAPTASTPARRGP